MYIIKVYSDCSDVATKCYTTATDFKCKYDHFIRKRCQKTCDLCRAKDDTAVKIITTNVVIPTSINDVRDFIERTIKTDARKGIIFSF